MWIECTWDLLRPLDVGNEVREEVAVLLRGHEADGVRDVERRRARFDHLGEEQGEKFRVGSPGVLRGELHVRRHARRVGHRLARVNDALVARDLQLVLQVDVARRKERVDAVARGVLDRKEGSLDVLLRSPGEASDAHRPVRPLVLHVANLLRHSAHRVKVARRGDREPCLAHVHAEEAQHASDLQLLAKIQSRPGRLLSITKGSVEDDKAVLRGRRHRGAKATASHGGRPGPGSGRAKHHCLRRAKLDHTMRRLI